MRYEWVKDFCGAITVCSPDGTIVEMNEKACRTFEKDGGSRLIGKNVLDCHPEPARTKLRELLDDQKSNIYTIEKAGVKKLIYQVPWYQDGRYGGMVELSIEIPSEMPHFIRKG